MARFPWDPEPKPDPPPQPAQTAPPPAPAAAAPSHQQAHYALQPPQPGPEASGAAPHNGIKQEHPIKNEPNIKKEPGTIAMPPPVNFNGMDGSNNVAAHRAAQLVQQQYGERAVGSINAIQQGHHTGPQQPQQGQQPDPQAAYRQQMAAATAQQQNAANGQGHLHNAQTDGAGEFDDSDSSDDEDFEGVLMRKNNAGELQELGRVEIDGLLHQRIAAKAKSMEGGGLMLSLREATRHQTMPNKDRKGKGKAIAGHDGGDDDEEVDEDAINSDLDDPDDGGSDDEVDDEGLGHIMLCMYDKVQRVKNKWSALPSHSHLPTILTVH